VAAFAVTSAYGTGGAPPAIAPVTNSHVAIVIPGPVVPIPVVGTVNADKTLPATPAGLRITGRSVKAISYRLGRRHGQRQGRRLHHLPRREAVGTSFLPGYTDNGLAAQTKYRYQVAAFDAAGNISLKSAAVAAGTLMEPDVSPPTIPAGLHSTGKDIDSVVLAWAGLARQTSALPATRCTRDGAIVANVIQPGTPTPTSGRRRPTPTGSEPSTRPATPRPTATQRP